MSPLALQNATLTILQTTSNSRGWGNKGTVLQAFLSWADKNSEVLFVDGFDTWLVCTLAEVQARAKTFAKRVIYSAESNFFPEVETRQTCFASVEYPTSPTRFRFLNSGAIYANVGRWNELWTDMVRLWGTGDNDQLYSHCMVLADMLSPTGRDIVLDVNATLFLSMFQQCEQIRQDDNSGRFQAPDSGKDSCVYHWNGPKDCQYPLIRRYLQHTTITEQAQRKWAQVKTARANILVFTPDQHTFTPAPHITIEPLCQDFLKLVEGQWLPNVSPLGE